MVINAGGEDQHATQKGESYEALSQETRRWKRVRPTDLIPLTAITS